MEYIITWLDHESGVLGSNTIKANDLSQLALIVASTLSRGEAPSETAQYTVELYDQ